jgi:hypothetical protein
MRMRFPAGGKPTIAIGLDTRKRMRVIVGVLSRDPLLALIVSWPFLNAIGDVLYLEEHALQVLLAPQFLSADLILAHQHPRHFLLQFPLLQGRLLELRRQLVHLLYRGQSLLIGGQPRQPFEFASHLLIICSMLLEEALELFIVILYDLQFLLSQHFSYVLEVTLDAFDHPQNLLLQILLPLF